MEKFKEISTFEDLTRSNSFFSFFRSMGFSNFEAGFNTPQQRQVFSTIEELFVFWIKVLKLKKRNTKKTFVYTPEFLANLPFGVKYSP